MAWLAMDDFGTKVGVSRRTVRRWRAGGRLRAKDVRVCDGGRVEIHARALAYLRSPASRRAAAQAMRDDGASYESIARTLGYADRSAAWRAVNA